MCSPGPASHVPFVAERASPKSPALNVLLKKSAQGRMCTERARHIDLGICCRGLAGAS